MLDEFDIVGTTDRFDDFARLLRATTGLPHVSYRQSVPDQRYLPPDHPLVTDAEICPDMQACRDHVARLTPFDQQLYEKYSKAFDARLRAESFAESRHAQNGTSHNEASRMEVAAVAPEAVGDWHGDEPPEAKCAWQQVDAPPGERLLCPPRPPPFPHKVLRLSSTASPPLALALPPTGPSRPCSPA